MKISFSHVQGRSSRGAGFTLMETVIAIGIVALLLTGFLTVFGPASSAIQRSLQGAEAQRLADAVETELNILREDDIGTYDSAFDKAFDLVLDSPTLTDAGDKNGGLFAYSYRAELPFSVEGSSGALRPYTGTDGIADQDFSVVAVARGIGGKNDDAELIRRELASLIGRVYFVRLIPLEIKENDGVFVNREEDPGTGAKLRGETSTNPEDYEGAGLPIAIEFYETPTTEPNFLTNNWSGPTIESRPLYSTNIIVRR